MSVPKNILLASIVIVIVAMFGVLGFIILKPKPVVAPTVTPRQEIDVTTTPTPVPKTSTQTFEKQIKLALTAPTDGSIVTTNKIVVKGVTAPLAEVFINDLELKADAVGNFSGTLTLEEGDNPISITAVDDNGNYSESELTVTYEP